MKYLGIDYEVKNMPVLDDEFVPFGVWMKEYLKGADVPIAVAVEREDGLVSVRESFIRGPEFFDANLRYVERLIKFELWSIGGFRVYVTGCDDIAKMLSDMYAPWGSRAFDYGFVGDVYEKPLEVIAVSRDDFPAANESAKAIGGHMDGCRIGFDAGGSDRKVSAVIDGESVYSEEVVWFPKVTEDPSYHFDAIRNGLQDGGLEDAARRRHRRVVRRDVRREQPDGRVAVHQGSPQQARGSEEHIRPRRGRDRRRAHRGGQRRRRHGAGGSHEHRRGKHPGNSHGNVRGRRLRRRRPERAGLDQRAGLRTCSDLSPCALQHEWSGNLGVGCKYFSQDCVIKLAPKAGIELDPELSPAEKLKVVQALAEDGHEGALDVFRPIGVYLAHTLVLYASFYGDPHASCAWARDLGRGRRF